MAFDRNKDKDESAIEDPAVKAETEAHPTPAVTPAGAPEGWTPENGAPDAENDNDLPESAPVTEVEHADAAPEAAPVEAKTYDAGEVHAALEKAGYKVADEDEVAEGRLGPSTRASVLSSSTVWVAVV